MSQKQQTPRRAPRAGRAAVVLRAAAEVPGPTPPTPARARPRGPAAGSTATAPTDNPPPPSAPRRGRAPADLAAWTLGSVAAATALYPEILRPFLPWLLAGAFLMALIRNGHLAVGRKAGRD